ncbi:unnamed protein product [Prorocentrum cordatum]|uniref:Uncharacterized protein n=1 Tax=Prorocentrum cordatum TaxID=2364126 RepID=A0ABN9PNF8_9DINO|nr:unnamed protein product [Polarella glacialis]
MGTQRWVFRQRAGKLWGKGGVAPHDSCCIAEANGRKRHSPSSIHFWACRVPIEAALRWIHHVSPSGAGRPRAARAQQMGLGPPPPRSGPRDGRRPPLGSQARLADRCPGGSSRGVEFGIGAGRLVVEDVAFLFPLSPRGWSSRAAEASCHVRVPPARLRAITTGRERLLAHSVSCCCSTASSCTPRGMALPAVCLASLGRVHWNGRPSDGECGLASPPLQNLPRRRATRPPGGRRLRGPGPRRLQKGGQGPGRDKHALPANSKFVRPEGPAGPRGRCRARRPRGSVRWSARGAAPRGPPRRSDEGLSPALPRLSGGAGGSMPRRGGPVAAARAPLLWGLRAPHAWAARGGGAALEARRLPLRWRNGESTGPTDPVVHGCPEHSRGSTAHSAAPTVNFRRCPCPKTHGPK